MDNRVLLSVCIPTYNGGKSLAVSLDILKKTAAGHPDVEVVVADNCSDDGITEQVLSKYNDIPNFHLYRNPENVGFNGNINLIINKYAVGKYCWIIGDDDYLDIDAITTVVDVLRNNTPSFIAVRHRTMTDIEFRSFAIPIKRVIEYSMGSYFKCLDLIATEGNVLGTFMSSHVFLLDEIKKNNFDQIGDNDWQDFRKVFPNSFFMTETFHNEKKCGCILTPIITAIAHPKNWEDKMYNIVMKVFPSYYNYCIELDSRNKKDLKQTRKFIRKSQVSRNIKELKSGRFSRVKWKSLMSLYTISELYSQVLFKFKQFSNR